MGQSDFMHHVLALSAYPGSCGDTSAITNPAFWIWKWIFATASLKLSRALTAQFAKTGSMIFRSLIAIALLLAPTFATAQPGDPQLTFPSVDELP